MASADDHILRLFLEVAVPLWIIELQGKPWSYIRERARACGEVIAADGDKVLYKVEGKTAAAFNRTAEGIACLAFAPGGVRAFGHHWQAEHPDNADPRTGERKTPL